MEPLIIFGIALALLFNFVNGANDAANSLAIMVGTRAVSPARAVLLATACTLVGPFLLSAAIAATIAGGILYPADLTAGTVVAGVAAALLLVLAATATGFPVSSSHALVGGLAGAGLAAGGVGALILPSRVAVIALLAFTFLGFTAGAALSSAAALLLREPVPLALLGGGIAGGCIVVPLVLAAGMLHLTAIGAILVFLVVSPCLAFFAALGLDILISHLFRFSRQPVMRRIFQPVQVAAGAFQAAGTGSNNSQHGAGVIAALLLAGAPLQPLPIGITAASAVALALGTMAGGWRVVEVVARKITRIRPYQGFAAGLTGGLVITATTLSGIPTSSTHAMDGSIVGVGATRGLRAVHWDAVREIVAAWIVTIPLSLACGWIFALAARAAGVG